MRYLIVSGVQTCALPFSTPPFAYRLGVTAAALALLPADFRVRTSLYANGGVAAGVLQGDLVFYGRGDPTFYAGCYGVDTPAAGVCDSTFTALDAIADSLRSKGLRRITRELVGDGSYFAPRLIHPRWNAFHLYARYAAGPLALALQRRGAPMEGGAASTPASLASRRARGQPPLAEYRGRPLADIVFPILNTSQNWFAEMLVKILGRELQGAGSWEAGLDVERRFLVDSVRIDSTAFALEDGSGLAAGDPVTPPALGPPPGFLPPPPPPAAPPAARPPPGQPGTLLKRLVGTPFESRVLAKTGSINRVNSLSGYIERPDGRTITFSVQANSHDVASS